MSFPFPGGDITDMLARLINSPQVKQTGRQLQYALPQASGPLRTGASYGMGNRQSSRSGVNPNIGAAAAGLADQIAAMGKGGQPQQQQDPLMNLYEQLISQLQSPVRMPTAVNKEDLMAQVQKAINPIYDQRAQAAQDRTGRATKEVKNMYGALADDYERLAPQQRAQAADARKQIEDLYGGLRTNIEGNYARVASEQGELFKKLGIEDALPDVLDGQDDQILEAQQAMTENQGQQEQRYMDIGNMDETYMREGSPNAVMTGNEISTDFIAQLQDYLGQNDAERTAGIQSGYMDQLGQANSQLAQQQQNAQQEASSKQQMLWQILQSQLQGNKQEALTPDTFMGGLPENTQNTVASAFTRLQRSPEAVYGKVEDKRNPVPGTFVETTPEWYMQQADQMLQNGEIDAATHQALLMYLQLNFKQ